LKTYIFHINLYHLTFLGTVFLGLAAALLLWFGKKLNQTANRFLAVALVVIVLYIARLLAVDVELASYIPNWGRLPLRFSLAFGPLVYFYVLQTTRAEYKFRLKHTLHFVPVLFELSIQLFETSQSIQTGVAAYQTSAFNLVLELLAFISALSYLYASHQQIENYYRLLEFNNGDRFCYQMRWLKSSTCILMIYRASLILYSKKALTILLMSTVLPRLPAKCRTQLLITSPCWASPSNRALIQKLPSTALLNN
jgi:hypothetical protein